MIWKWPPEAGRDDVINSNQQRAEKKLFMLRYVEKLNYVKNKTERRTFQTDWDMQRSCGGKGLACWETEAG